MKVLFISDPHTKEKFLKIPSDIEMVVCAGNIGTYRNPSMNANGVLDFLAWYRNLSIPHKVLIPGNHDTSIEGGLIDKKEFDGIHFLQHEMKTVAGLKIFGSPYTPSFGDGWAYNVPRSKLDSYWKSIPEDLDILITHGPPKGILDLTINQDGHPFQCGCKSLLNRIRAVEPRYHVFGHIHTESDCPNSGVFKHTQLKTTFINAAIVNLQYELINDGIILDI